MKFKNTLGHEHQTSLAGSRTSLRALESSFFKYFAADCYLFDKGTQQKAPLIARLATSYSFIVHNLQSSAGFLQTHLRP